MLDGLRFGSPHRPRLVHRLDRDTSGVLLLARTPGVAAKLAALFRGRDVEKTYWAVVAGRPVPPQGRIELTLVRSRPAPAPIASPSRHPAIRTPPTPSPTTARSTTPDGGSPGWNCGRSPAARTSCACSCAAIGAPILGDAAYGEAREDGNSALVEGFPLLLHLHARAPRVCRIRRAAGSASRPRCLRIWSKHFARSAFPPPPRSLQPTNARDARGTNALKLTDCSV